MWVYMRVDEQRWQPWVNTMAYRPLTSDVNDASGNGHNWTNLWVTFASWQATENVWYFNGSSYISVPHSTDFFGSGVFTISLWFKNTALGSVAWDFVGKWWDAQANTVLTRIHYRSDIRDIFNFSTKSSSNQDSSVQINNAWFLTGDWIHLVCTFNNGISVVYKNNTEIMSGDHSSYTFNFWNNTNPLFIGNSMNADGTSQWYFFNWYMSNVIIENKARTAQEIADYYDLTKSLYGIS